MEIKSIQPQGWKDPSGYSNGMLVSGAAAILHVAGQIAWDAEQRLVGGEDFIAQFRQALGNVVAVVAAAGGKPVHILSLTIYVTDKALYLERVKEIGGVYRQLVGRHFPAMALLQVADLLDTGALVEIQAVAALPS